MKTTSEKLRQLAGRQPAPVLYVYDLLNRAAAEIEALELLLRDTQAAMKRSDNGEH